MRIDHKGAGLIVLVLVLAGLVALPALSSGERSAPVRPERMAGMSEVEVAGKVPVVMVVFDGLPTATLTNRSGKRISARRFPGFAKLAEQSTWYRINTTVADFTGRAIPAIETGNVPGYRQLPVASEHPDSIFTLLAEDYRFNVHEPLTRVCPRELCHHPGPALGDTKGLTAGEFAQALHSKPKPRHFKRFLERIPSRGRSFNFIHFEVPHEPFHFLPDGRSYNYAPISDVANANAQKWAGGRGGAATTWQRHYIQTGLADTLTRRMIKRVKEAGIWSEALVIVTSDHGMSFDPRTFRRIAVPGNFGGIANPILFVKYPGQTEGDVSNLHTRTIDLVPTIAQVLGIELGYETDGAPISEAGYGGMIRVHNALNKVAREPFRKFKRGRRRVLRRAARDLGARTALFRLGPRSDLLGRRAPGGGSGGGATIDRRLELGNVRGKVPAFVNGTARGSLAGKVLAIGVNGRIVATCRAFRFRGRTRWGAIVRPSKLHGGRNSVGVYRVRGRRLVRIGGT